MPLTDEETQELADFITRVRKVWKDRDAEGRRALERRFEEMVGGMFSDFMWKSRYEELAERYDRALEHEAGEARRTVSRVTKLAYAALSAKHKTIRTDDLTIALSKCEVCGKDAAHMWRGRPLCESDYNHIQEVT